MSDGTSSVIYVSAAPSIKLSISVASAVGSSVSKLLSSGSTSKLSSGSAGISSIISPTSTGSEKVLVSVVSVLISSNDEVSTESSKSSPIT